MSGKSINLICPVCTVEHVIEPNTTGLKDESGKILYEFNCQSLCPLYYGYYENEKHATKAMENLIKARLFCKRRLT